MTSATLKRQRSWRSDEARSSRRKNVPRHIGIIMDGNGRWAQRQGLPRAKGHEAGTRNIRRISEKAHELGVDVLTLYAFSTENWTRPDWEVKALMRIFGETVRKEKQTILDNNIQLHVIGRLEGIPGPLRNEIMSVVHQSAP